MHLFAKEEITMAMVVKNNMSAISTLNTLNTNQSRLAKSLAQVSSGMKINSAQDDASGYAISERMRVMTRSLDQANDNTQNGSSLMKVAEGAVGKTVEILRTLKEKAIAAATDTKTNEDRATIQKEINQLVDQIDDNALVTFNGKYLIDGSKSGAGAATYSTWTNQALSEGTSALTKLTELKARDGEALTIEKNRQSYCFLRPERQNLCHDSISRR
jgi:flagellin